MAFETIKNRLMYSVSRGDVLTDKKNGCRRKYFYSYYFHWNGWSVRKSIKQGLDDSFKPEDLETPIRKKIAYTFKKATGKYLHVGVKIHSQIEKLLELAKLGNFIDTEFRRNSFVDMAVEKFRSELKASVEDQKTEAFLDKPKKHTFFIEYLNSCQFSHGHPNILPPSWARFVDDLTDLYEINLKSFFECKLYEGLYFLSKRSDIFDVEPSYSYTYKFKYEGKKYAIPVQIRPDLLTLSDGVLSIYDWKTGSSRNIKFFQLQFYAYMLKRAQEDGVVLQDKTIDSIKLKIYALKEGKPLQEEYDDSAFDIESLHSVFADMIDITDSGIELNSVADSRELEFEVNRNAGMFGCRTCPFLKICPGTAEKLGFL